MSTLLRLAAAACLLPAVALADKPAVKLGLWEISHQSDATAQTPIPEDVINRLPPEARARLEASRQSRTAGGRSSKQCVTQTSIDRMFQDKEHEQICKRTIVSQTANSMEMHLECKGKGASTPSSTGTFKWTLVNPETMQGTIDMMTVVGPRTMNHKIELKGKWLSADCGEVKPNDASNE